MYNFFSPEAIIPDDHDEVDLNEFDPKVKNKSRRATSSKAKRFFI